MPLVQSPHYQAKGLFSQGDINTIFPALFRRVKGPDYQRGRLELADGDFLDLDKAMVGNSRQIILVLHGLEASSQAHYVRAMIKHFNRMGWDGVAMNFRGCSGEPNRLLRSYHSGETEDLRTVLLHLHEHLGYDEIILAGFSLGGNVLLKYLGEEAKSCPSYIKAGIAISAPVDITNCSQTLSRARNWVYVKRFMLTLNEKLRQKMQAFPDRIHLPHNRLPKTFAEFDGLFTAPVNGFIDEWDYWKKASSKPYIPSIDVPTLILNPLDDPFFGEPCYPFEECEKHPTVFLETPQTGGHVALTQLGNGGVYGAEERAWSFVKEIGW